VRFGQTLSPLPVVLGDHLCIVTAIRSLIE